MDGAIFIATALRGNHQLTYIKSVCFCVCVWTTVCVWQVQSECVTRWHSMCGKRLTPCHTKCRFKVSSYVKRMCSFYFELQSLWSVTEGGIILRCLLTCFICASVFRVMALVSQGQRWSRMLSELEHRSVWWTFSEHALTTILCQYKTFTIAVFYSLSKTIFFCLHYVK